MTTISTLADLRAHFGAVSERAVQKEIRVLDKHVRHFISLSPFLCMATSANNGLADNTPRGDAPGFVSVLDDQHLLLPERPGNNRLDTLTNLIENPAIGLVFFLPGIRETLRINGTASIIVDDPRLEELAVKGKVPAAGILIEAKEVYFHCGKAIIRSRLWEEDTKIERSQFPSLGQILADQIPDIGPSDKVDENLEEAYKSRLY